MFCSVFVPPIFDIIIFLFITCVTYNQNLEIIALFTDLNISLFLYCRVHCLSGEGMLLLIINVKHGLCQECVFVSMYISGFGVRLCWHGGVWWLYDMCVICDVLHNVSVPRTASRTLGGRLLSDEHVFFVTVVTASVFCLTRITCLLSSVSICGYV